MARIRILPYKQGSASAKALADALGAKVLKLENSAYRPKASDTVILWGGETPAWWGELAFPPAVFGDNTAPAKNKLTAFQFMQRADVQIPDFWTNQEDIPNDAYPIVCRTILSGHSGRGIVIANTPDELVLAPLYVRYIKKLQEYRIHVGKGDQPLIAQQRKTTRNGQPALDTKIRNHDNGYIFVREGVQANRQILDQSLAALAALGLDFGAVDVIWNDYQKKAYVLEVNTAPGLEGQTILDYKTYFERMI